VQGRLRNESLTLQITTECAHCGDPIHLEVDSGLGYRVVEPKLSPLVVRPLVDIASLRDPSIIDAF
jgi:hypothetical protein